MRTTGYQITTSKQTTKLKSQNEGLKQSSTNKNEQKRRKYIPSSKQFCKKHGQ